MKAGIAPKVLLDTSVYSQRLRPKPAPGVVARWKQAGDQALAISVICEAELLYGLEKRKSERLWTEYDIYLKDRLVTLPVDRPVAEAYAKLRAELEGKGEPRADFDLIIAATALAYRLCLATLNTRHFQGIPGLQVEDWNLPT